MGSPGLPIGLPQIWKRRSGPAEGSLKQTAVDPQSEQVVPKPPPGLRHCAAPPCRMLLSVQYQFPSSEFKFANAVSQTTPGKRFNGGERSRVTTPLMSLTGTRFAQGPPMMVPGFPPPEL